MLVCPKDLPMPPAKRTAHVHETGIEPGCRDLTGVQQTGFSSRLVVLGRAMLLPLAPPLSFEWPAVKAGYALH
jgi:hypothetical protein